MLAVIVLALLCAAEAQELDLKYVAYVHRHGNRSPVGTYPNDPHGNESLWNNGWGQLTNEGKRSAYELGVWMRKRYDGFLPAIYNHRDYEVRSTDVSRTLMSALLVLAGLYPPTGTDVWNQKINWQPIPVRTIPQALDNVLAANKPCPRHSQLLSELMTSKEINSQISAELLQEVVTMAGYNSSNTVQNFLLGVTVFDSLFVQHDNGLQLPKWSSRYFPQPLQNYSSLYLRTRTYNRPLQRLSCGMLVKDILTKFKAKAGGALTQKVTHYSAHDITIVGLRQCLGFHETDTPPYASALILELVEIGGKNSIRVLYKKKEELRTLVIPGCTDLCPLNKFEELMTPIIPEDWEAECKLSKPTVS